MRILHALGHSAFRFIFFLRVLFLEHPDWSDFANAIIFLGNVFDICKEKH